MRAGRRLALVGLLIVCSVGRGEAGENGSSNPFLFKTVVVGVYVSTKGMKGVGEMEGLELNFRDIIFNGLMGGEGGNNETMTQVSNITLLPLDLDFEEEKIAALHGLVSVGRCDDTYELNRKVTLHYGVVFHVAVTEPGCPRLKESTSVTVPLTMFRHRDELLQLLVDMRERKTLAKWEEAIIIHDKFTGLDILDSVEEGLSRRLEGMERGVEFTTWSVDSRHASKSFEVQMEDFFGGLVMKEGKFIVITPVANIEATLGIAKRMNVLKFSTQWLFLGPDVASRAYNRWDYVRDKILGDGTHLAFVSNRTGGSGSYKQLFCAMREMLTIFRDTIEEFASEEFNLYVQVSDEEWDNIRASREEGVEMLIRNVTDNLDGVIQTACESEYLPGWILEAGENGAEGKRVFQVGHWHPFSGLELWDDLFPHIMGGFRGRRIKVASMHFPPWHIITLNASTGRQMYSGLMFEILGHMGSSLNFSYEVLEPRDGGGWGVESFDGSWNGMMKQVISEEVMQKRLVRAGTPYTWTWGCRLEKYVILGAAAFTIRPEKAKVVNFTTTIEREAYTFMVNRPSELSRVLLFAEPFRKEVWFCIAGSVLLVGNVFYLLHKYSPYYIYHGKRNDRGLFLVKNCYLYVYGALLQQGGSRLPEAVSGRMLIGFWWVFVLVTITTYSGNLVAFLTFPRVELPVNSISDLVNYRGVQSWGFLGGSVIESYLKVSNSTEMVKLYREAIKHPELNDTVLKRIRYQEHAYIDWKISLILVMKEAYLASGKCEFVLGKEEIFQEQIAMIVPRSSPYLPMFNEEIKAMLRSGLMIKWRAKYWPKKDKCSSLIAAAAANRTVKIGDMQGSFYILSLGIFLSALILLGEYLWFRREQNKVVDTIKTIVSQNTRAEFWQQKQLPFLH